MSRQPKQSDKPKRRIRFRRLSLEALECREMLTGFTVTTALDNGNNVSPTPNSLRAAIIAANADPTVGADSISFAIPGPGTQTIALQSALPAITRTVVIDGTTQSMGTATPVVVLDGSAAGLGANGLTFSAGSSSVVRDLAIVGNTATAAGVGGNAILVEGTATQTVIEGNYIGIGADGVTAKSNSNGIVIASANNTVGGTTASARNVVANSTFTGILIIGSGASGNLVAGNYVGTDASGDVAAGNQVGIGLKSPNNTVGGTTAGAANVISGNVGPTAQNGIGILLGGQATGELIEGNKIGTNAAGTGVLQGTQGNFQNIYGIYFGTPGALPNTEQVKLDTIGGTVAGAGNLISGNFKNGITVVNAANGNVIQGNNVGLDPTGTIGRGNRLNGIYITTSGNLVGGTTAGSGNLVSGNLNSGVVLSTLTAFGNTVEGDYIGTDVTGGDNPNVSDPGNGVDGAPIGNRQDGVFVNDDAARNTIGGTSAGARNVISGNGSNGVQILAVNVLADPAPPGDVVEGNLIGTDVKGLVADSNAAAGVFVYNARDNTVGAGNLISGNLGSGVAIQGEAATGNVVEGNRIGTDVSGVFGLPNSGDGVTVVEADDNQVGGLGPGEANLILYNGGTGVSISSNSNFAVVVGDVISANGGDGVTVASGSNHALIAGNRIGTDPTGEIARGNGLDGVRLANAGLGSQVLSDVISGSAGAGVEVSGTSSTAVIQGNLIGLDALGKAALGNAVGVAIDGVRDVVVGGLAPGTGNFISGNSVGVQVTAGSNTSLRLDDLIAGNVIGLDASGTKAVGNAFGVFLNDAVGVTIGGTTPAARNVISGNTGAGVQVFRVSLGGSGNTIQGNTIGLDAAGMAVPAGAVQPIGVFLNAAANNTIGGTAPGSGNLISGNTTGNPSTPSYGISIFGQSGGEALDNAVEGNLIGTNAAGGALPTVAGTPVQTIGVVMNTSAGNVIGGLRPSARNGIGGNVVGVEVVGLVEKFPGQPTGNVIVGDTIDANTFGAYINEAQGNAVLGDDLSRNTSIGLSIVGSLATGNTATGDVIDANLQDGVYIEAAASNAVQGASPNQVANNQVDGSGQVGVYIALGANGNQVRRNTIRGSKQYGIFLYNAAGNLGAVPRTGPDANAISGSGIADFREFTGPLTTTTGSSTPQGPKSRKKAK